MDSCRPRSLGRIPDRIRNPASCGSTLDHQGSHSILRPDRVWTVQHDLDTWKETNTSSCKPVVSTRSTDGSYGSLCDCVTYSDCQLRDRHGCRNLHGRIEGSPIPEPVQLFYQAIARSVWLLPVILHTRRRRLLRLPSGISLAKLPVS